MALKGISCLGISELLHGFFTLSHQRCQGFLTVQIILLSHLVLVWTTLW